MEKKANVYERLDQIEGKLDNINNDRLDILEEKIDNLSEGKSSRSNSKGDAETIRINKKINMLKSEGKKVFQFVGNDFLKRKYRISIYFLLFLISGIATIICAHIFIKDFFQGFVWPLYPLIPLAGYLYYRVMRLNDLIDPKDYKKLYIASTIKLSDGSFVPYKSTTVIYCLANIFYIVDIVLLLGGFSTIADQNAAAWLCNLGVAFLVFYLLLRSRMYRFLTRFENILIYDDYAYAVFSPTAGAFIDFKWKM